MANLFEAIASAAANIATQIKDYIDNVALVEKDPTVPTWAKQALKPTYTADEVTGISEVGKTGEYLDLLGAPHADFTAGEFDTGRKWVDGRKIYANAIHENAVAGSLLMGINVQLIPVDTIANCNILGYTGTLTDPDHALDTLPLSTSEDSGFYLNLTNGRLTINRDGTYNALVYYIKTNE